MRKMTLSEFGWKLCATALYLGVVSYLGFVSLIFFPDKHGLGKPLGLMFVILFVASWFVVPIAAIVAIAGHIWARWSRPPHSR
jgi:hypothetical protein